MSDTQTHDYTVRHRGHDVTIQRVEDGGKWLHASGWGGGIADGHFLILPNGDTSTRYRVSAIDYYRDPPDMWHAELEHAPRQPGTEGGVS